MFISYIKLGSSNLPPGIYYYNLDFSFGEPEENI